MKKFTIYTIMIIIIPVMTILIFNKDIQLKQFIFEKNTKVRVKRVEKNTIETLPLEQYLVGVLAGEMPVSYELEALKAQAVAARTYTLKKLQSNKKNEYDIQDTTNDQVYLDQEYLKQIWGQNYENNLKKIKQAINETTGEYLTYNGEIIQAFFFSTSSGKTENCKDVFGSDLPYLISVSSTWDTTSPSYNGKNVFSLTEFYNKLEQPYSETLNIDITRNETNSIKTINVNGVDIKGTDFRHKLGLKSTNVEIIEENNSVTVISKGYGHGVGMSQYGALELAKQGYKYNEILKYYYQGIDFKKI